MDTGKMETLKYTKVLNEHSSSLTILVSKQDKNSLATRGFIQYFSILYEFILMMFVNVCVGQFFIFLSLLIILASFSSWASPPNCSSLPHR